MSIFEPETLHEMILSLTASNFSTEASSKIDTSLFRIVFLSLPDSWFWAPILTGFLNIFYPVDQ